MDGTIFNIEKFRIHDGDGIRTAVFLKGCNLKCPWCSNPESQSMKCQTVVHQSLCTACLSCFRNCPTGAIYHIDTIVKTNQDLCTTCGRCVQFCPNSARQIYGSQASVEEVMKEVMKDAAYYSRSGGGVTISGGDPVMQWEFTRAILQQCKAEYLPTAIETAGFFPWEQLWAACELADDILLDIKTTNPEDARIFLHEKANSAKMMAMQQENISKLVEKGKNVIFRCPIIPGYNDVSDHMDAVVELAQRTGVKKIDVLPFHQFGKHKYSALGLPYTLEGLAPLPDEAVAPFLEIIRAAGLEGTIGG